MPLKGILIIGKDPELNHKIANDFDFYKNNPDYAIIDASQEFMTQEEFRAKLAEYEIDSNTRIDIWAHGGRNERADGSADHSIALLSDTRLTKDVLSIISSVAGSKPIQAHLWSCYGGTAARAVENLPEGSIVMGHGPEKSTTSLNTNKKAINDSISAAITNDTNRMSSVGQDLVNNMPSYIMQDLNIGIKGVNSEVERFHFDEASSNISEVESIRGLFTGYSKQIISAIDDMKERGLLPPEIELPVMKTYSEAEISSYEFDRTLFDLFLRSDFFGKHANLIDFSKIIRDGVLISQEEAKSLNLNERERKLLDPEFQNKLLNARDINGDSYLLQLTRYSNDWKNRDGSIDYLIEISKKNNRAEEYLSKGNKYGLTPLTRAFRDKATINKLINSGVPISILDEGNQVLLSALRTNANDIARLMIEGGANLNEGNPLLLAVRNGNTDIARLMIEGGANLNEGNPLSIAVGSANTDIAKLLIENGANVNARDQNGNLLIPLNIRRDNRELFEKLKQGGLDINSRNNNGENLLVQTIKSNVNTKFIEFLIENGADVNAKDRDGNSILSLAVEKNLDRSLIQKISDRIEDRTLSKSNLLRKSIIDDNLESIRNCINEGAQIHEPFLLKPIPQPFEYLRHTNNIEIAIFLLDKIKNKRAIELNSVKVIETVSDCNNLEVAKLLYEKVNDRDKERYTPQYINSSKNKDVARYLFGQLSKESRSQISFSKIGKFVNGEVLGILRDDGVVIDKDKLSIAVGNWKFEECKVLVDSGYVEMNDFMIESFKQGRAEFVNSLLEAGFNPNIKNREGVSVFNVALESGNLDLVKKMIGRGADVNARDSKGVAPLEMAIIGGKGELANFLLDSGADFNSKNERGISSFNLALESGNLDLVKKMIGKGADVNARNRKGFAPLEMAIMSGKGELVNFLLDSGVDFNSKNERGISSFNLVLESGNLDLVKKMIGKGADVNARDSKGVAPLEMAIMSGKGELANFLLDSGADFNSKNERGISSFNLALESGNLDLVKKMIGKGADVNARDSNGMSILLKVIVSGNAEVVKTLIDAGADVNVRDMNGNGILGSSLCNDKIVKILLERGADVNIAPGHNHSALTNVLRGSASDENKKRAKLLIEYGAYITKKKGGVAPVDKARENGLEDFVIQEKKNYRMRRTIKENRSITKESILGRFQGDPNGVDSEGKTMLSYAIEARHLDAVKKLIKMGADVNSVSQASGLSLLHEAAKSGNKEIYNKLVEAGANTELLDRDGRKPSEYLPETRVASAMRTSLDVSYGASVASSRNFRGVIETKNASKAGAVRG